MPGDGRMWTPSLYAGAIVGAALILTSRAPEKAWAGTLVVDRACFHGTCASGTLERFGSFNKFRVRLRSWDSAVGGPYWILWSGLKGYSAFRYPVKWLPVFALAASMVTANWIDRPTDRNERRWLIGLVVAALVAAVIHQLILMLGFEIGSRHVDEYWGPLDQRGGWWLARNSWVICAVSIAVLVVLRSRMSESRIATGLLILIIAVDAGWNAHRLMPLISIQREDRVVGRQWRAKRHTVCEHSVPSLAPGLRRGSKRHPMRVRWKSR